MKPWAVVIHAWDPYEWAWPSCLKCFDKFFAFKACSNAYFITSGKTFYSPADKNFKVLPSPGALWTDRLRAALQAIPEEYILYFQEDMWPNRTLSVAQWTGLFNLFSGLSMNVLRMEAAGPLYTLNPFGLYYGDWPIYRLDDSTSNYLLSCQPSFWRKQFLLDNLKHSEEAWDFEIKGTERIRGQDNRVFFYPMDWFCHVIRKGKYVPELHARMKQLVGF